MNGQKHQSDARILSRRTLVRDHQALVALLAPGMHVLDAGCGVGAIAAGIAAAVGPEGRVVGIDRDLGMIRIAQTQASAVLRFEVSDIIDAPYIGQFDIVTAARTLQWIAEPARAVTAMVRAAKPGGWVVVLDYNHAANSWMPVPPPEFTVFYQAFLAWRAAHGWDNQMADHLPDLFRSAGLLDVTVSGQSEVARPEDPDFGETTLIWEEVIEKVGARMAESGFIQAAQLEAASRVYRQWRQSELRCQTLQLKAVIGRVAPADSSPRG